MQADKNELTPQELAWFRELKLLCETHHMEVSSDYEIACYALVCKGSTVKALSRMAKMKKLEREHNLSSIDSVTAYQTLAKLCPGMFAACGRDKQGNADADLQFSSTSQNAFHRPFQEAEKRPGRYLPPLLPPFTHSPPSSRQCTLKVLLDAFDASTASIHDVREGTSWLCNCNGMGWSNFSFEMEKKISMLYQDGYPIKIKAM
ncbi:hypothetical protein GUITHDRAFT_117430 [Guillardia theta CCMP2712]|uniref:Uncharacterized protein n=1 Tax=Guillardia theta (strain CCMP2712) TaxID=905079 RepID=L1IK01_GUITC|nr:hypothetical protein GUITHDRAFT_117430 [Guillardia theta CCMP2712]EKX36432.1 hypothetical protein GUITHDRAFT_117430 [Guillardia theta CCMP2712]|eukprot:XP_005823412.1 hypothetical protein GUITHDRAFT_117430 [Guillardia theta CCMP2712]